MCKSQRPESRHQLSPRHSTATKTQISGDWGCSEPPRLGPSPTFAASCRPFSSAALMCQSGGRSGPSCCDITATSPRLRSGRLCGRRSAGNTPRSSRRGKGAPPRPLGGRGCPPKRCNPALTVWTVTQTFFGQWVPGTEGWARTSAVTRPPLLASVLPSSVSRVESPLSPDFTGHWPPAESATGCRGRGGGQGSLPAWLTPGCSSTLDNCTHTPVSGEPPWGAGVGRSGPCLQPAHWRCSLSPCGPSAPCQALHDP